MDELTKPLGLKKQGHKTRRPIDWVKPVLGLSAALVVFVGLWVWLTDDPFGGQPATTVELAGNQQSNPRNGLNGNVPLRQKLAGRQKTYTTSDPTKPARLEEPKPANPGGLKEILVNGQSQQQGTTGLSYRPEKELSEKSAYGYLPKRATNGRSPFTAYARPVESFGATKIAIIVGGLGLSQSGTLSAIENLPADVTLGFAAYGNSLRRWMEKARKDGHELVLQLPMEPTNYPQVNPGKQTLLTSVTPDQNINNLHWLLGRITNYATVMNYLGAAMALDEQALAPIMREINARGLAYLDDGSVPHGSSAKLAQNLQMPFARSQMIVDQRRSAKEIDRMLRQLEKIARRNGSAIGVASAFPISVERISRWVDKARSRGLEIVPLSALMKRSGN